MKTATAFLALAVVAEGSPLFTKRDDDDVFSDKGRMCKGWNLRTAEGVEELWKKTEAGIDLELFINGHPGTYPPLTILISSTNYIVQSTKTTGSRILKIGSWAVPTASQVQAAVVSLEHLATPWAASAAKRNSRNTARHSSTRTRTGSSSLSRECTESLLSYTASSPPRLLSTASRFQK